MTTTEKCIAWFNENGVHAWSPTKDDDVFIYVNDFEINISSAEVYFRAELYDSEREVTNEA